MAVQFETFPSFEEDMKIIQKLGDHPNSDDLLSSQALKEKFDEGGIKVKAFLLNTITQLNKLVGILNQQFNSAGDLLGGGTMRGNLNMNGYALSGISSPNNDSDAVTKKYADAIKETASNAATAAGKALTAAVSKTNATITLSANGWAKKEQTVNVPGVTTDEDCDVLITPGNVGYLSYLDCVVRGKEQGDGTVTFICEDVPEEDVSANIMILSKGVKS